MKAVVLDVPRELIERRRRTGADRYDEMWKGVLHMPPAPDNEHQALGGDLADYLRRVWARPRKARVYLQVNLAAPGGWPHDYRIPDCLLLSPGRFHTNRGAYFEGPPDVVVEIRSPDDESEEKLDFYAAVSVPEVWILDRETWAPKIFTLEKGAYRKQRRGANGWFQSPATGLEMKAGRPGRLAIRAAGDDRTREDLPAQPV